MNHRISPGSKQHVASGKPYPPFCHIHECRMVFRHGQWTCPVKESSGWKCRVACTDEQARDFVAEVL